MKLVARGFAGPSQATTRDPPRKKSARRVFATAEHIDRYTIHIYKLCAPRNGVKRSSLRKTMRGLSGFDSGREGPIIFSPCFGCQPASFCWHSSRCYSQAHSKRGGHPCLPTHSSQSLGTMILMFSHLQCCPGNMYRPSVSRTMWWQDLPEIGCRS